LITAGAMGVPFELTDKGPVIEYPLRTAAQICELSNFDPERETRFLMEAIRGLVRELGPAVPVLGFAAAPWTLACYMVEGHGKDGFPAAKTMLYSDPDLFRNLLERIAHATARYLRAQIAAGATAVQLFDTWVGELTREQYREFALPATQLLIEEIGAGETPVILYTKASSHLLEAAAESGASVLSVDWREDLAPLRDKLGNRIALQGNVDPCVLLGPAEGARSAAREAVESTGGVGHILNLGHGILQQTQVENARAFVQAGQNVAVAAGARLEGAL
jgi:uroporphyrinogen decarboxylase